MTQRMLPDRLEDAKDDFLVTELELGAVTVGEEGRKLELLSEDNKIKYRITVCLT